MQLSQRVALDLVAEVEKSDNIDPSEQKKIMENSMSLLRGDHRFNNRS